MLAAVAAINADIKKMVRASDACRRLMTIPGVGQLTALAFAAAVDDPERFRRSRDVGPYLGLVPRRYQSGEVDDTEMSQSAAYFATPNPTLLRAPKAVTATSCTWPGRPDASHSS